MRALELWTLGYVLNSLWQAPVIFAAAWLAARMLRRVGPRAEHRVWVSALLAETVLPLCDFRMSGLWHAVWAWVWRMLGVSGGAGQVQVLVGPGAMPGHGGLRLPAEVIGLLLALYGCGLIYLCGRLVWGLWRTRALSRAAAYLTTASEQGQRVEAHGRAFGIRAEQVAVTRAVPGPMTVGLFRRVLLLPPGFLEHVGDSDLDAVLSHESAHMRRRDFARNLLYRFASLPVAYHPAVWRTFAALAESREIVCDGMAAESVAGRESYARSLLRLASMLSPARPVAPLHAIGIFDANIFERRVMRLTGKQNELRGARRLAIVLGCVALGMGTGATAVALGLHVNAASTVAGSDDSKPAKPKTIQVSAAEMAVQNLTKVNPKYPAEAKKARIQGTIVLKAVIGKDGTVENLVVLSGPKELQQCSLDAVRQWTYKPFLLNGEPVTVETTISVIYSLAS